MPAIERVFILNLEDQVMRAGITIGNLLTQNVPEDIITLYPAKDGRNKSLKEVTDGAVADGFEHFGEFYYADDWKHPNIAIEVAIMWSYLSLIRTIRDEVQTCALFILDDCMLNVDFWDLESVATALLHGHKQDMKIVQLGRYTPATHRFEKPVPVTLKDTHHVFTRITQELAFGDYGTLITPAGATMLLAEAQSTGYWLMEQGIKKMEGDGVYSLYPSVIRHEWYKTHWLENSR